ncbi:MAG: response regulator transcription factor [Rhodospirillales bacterium]
MNQDGAGKKILLVDDDEMLVEMLVDQLKLHEEFTITTAPDGAAALTKAKAEYFDIVLLDVGLPDMDGREVCRLMRRAGVRAPIIMLTAADADADTILGLDAGANDYVTKPFRLSVLLARLRAHIRQYERSDDAVFAVGSYTFQPSGKVMIDEARGKKIRLTDKETAILKHLYRAGGRVAGREALLDEVWGYRDGVTTHTLETHIYRLRQKIEDDPANARILLTEPGGYRLAAPPAAE